VRGGFGRLSLSEVLGVREEYRALMAKNPNFSPAFPAATNPVLRRPPRPEGRVWLENLEAIAVV